MQPLFRLSRRRFLALIAGLPVGHTLLGRLHGVNESAGTARAANSSIKAATTVLPPSALVAAGADDVSVMGAAVAGPELGIGIAVSQIVAAPFPFQAVAARWSAEGGLSVFIRTSPDGADWTDWQLLVREVGRDAAGNQISGGLVLVPNDGLHKYAQCRLVLAPQLRGQPPSLRDFDLTFIDATAGPTAGAAAGAEASQFAVEAAGLAKPSVVSRTSWRCPEGQASPRWSPSYRSVTHMVIHHTATTNSASDWSAQVRIIWQYHANTLGWGDIGYNYLVDPNGVLYEGRAGGDDVIAGHTYTFNAGTLGIGFLGTYLSVAPTQAALAAVERLIAWKCDQKGYRPTDIANVWRSCDGGEVAKERVAGHRDYAGLVCSGFEDLNNTSCPGNALHALLPSIRNNSAALIPVYTAEITSAAISPVLVRVGATLTLTITVRNTGTHTLRDGSPGPSHVYEEGQVAPAGATDTFRIGLDYEGRPQGQAAYPYRWGLGGDLAPGQSRTISCAIKINYESGPRKYWVGLIRESNRVMVDHAAETTVYARVKSFSGDAGIANVRIGPTTVFSGGYLEISAEVQNWRTTGNLPTQAPAPGYAYREGEVCPADQSGCFRIGLDYSGRPGTVKDHPYRWGVGTVPPLSVRTVKGFVKMPNPTATRDFWVGFVQEGVAWHQDGLARTGVKVQDPKSRLYLPAALR